MIIHRRSGGFSLLEVLVAIVVLTVGLLALAASAGSLTRASSDAKVRARVAAMLSARMDELRGSNYGDLTPEGTQAAVVSSGRRSPPTTATRPTRRIGTDWIDCARMESASAASPRNRRSTPGTARARSPRPAPALNAQTRTRRAVQARHAQRVVERRRRRAPRLQLVSDVSAMTLTSSCQWYRPIRSASAPAGPSCARRPRDRA
jgi:prepilin-type N-terminal cleavage/methylation domain-containing protein